MHLVVQIVSCILLLDTVRAACHADCGMPNGSCDPVDEITCLCEPGYHGLDCQTDGTTDCGGSGVCPVGEVCIDAGVCSIDCPTCDNSGTCVTTGLATGSARVCKCLPTNVGDLCELVCPTAPACDGVLEKCVPDALDTAAECDCKLGLSGVDCITVDCTAGDPCLNGATCDDTTDPDTCACDTTTQAGVICQHDCASACDNGGTCVEAASGTEAECSCPNTHAGDTCQLPCPGDCNTGTCVVATSGTEAECSCPNTHAGDTCQLDCPGDCNTGTCVEASSGTDAECSCPNTHAGDTCQLACPGDCNTGTCVEATSGTEAECSCLNTHAGDTCQLACPGDCNTGTCVEATSGTEAECSCLETHVGDMCQHACPTGADACDDDFATCEANAGNTAAVCVCKPGLSGDGCTTVDCALGNPCLSGGTCVTGSDPDTCRCAALTHSGVICEHECLAACTAPQVCSGNIAGTCQNCATTCTEHYKECVSGATTPVCSCKLGLSGAECTTVICADGDPCQNDGTCENNACTCDTTTHTGDLCQLECADTCAAPEICSGTTTPTCQGCATTCAEHYEECVAGDEAPECKCRAGLSGTDCLTITCTAGDPCLNDGTCETNACSCNTTLSAGDICQFACTDECAEGQTCEEGDGVGTCSGATTVLASMVLLFTTLARRLF